MTICLHRFSHWLLVFCLAFVLRLELSAQPRLYGLSPQGGDVFGTIYSTNGQGGDLRLEHKFEGNPGAYPYYTKLCDGNNGNLYGLTTLGGRYGNGVLFALDTATNSYEKLIDFNGQVTGASPRGSLTRASNGKLYGMCSQGGSNGFGTLFEFNISNDSFKVLHHFDGDSTGKFPFSYLVQANNGKLYGLCYQGGLSNEGVLFEYDVQNDTLIKRIDFDGTVKGRNPYGSLLQASNGYLYGMSYQGGANNYGTFYSYDPSSNAFSVKFDFNGTDLGSNPYGTPVEHSNGSLYALTYLGGSSNFGTLIEYDPVADTVYKHFDFAGGLSGRNPFGDLVNYNGLLYGIAPFGGVSNAGVIFAFDPSNNIMSKQADVPGSINGSGPYGSLTVSGAKMYGCTYQGGSNASGVLFKFDPAGKTYKKLMDLNSAPKGSKPFGGLCEASNGRYYGMTFEGGKSNAGLIFEFEPESGTYSVKAEFISATTGKNPYGSLVEGDDSALYGYCYQGGAYDFGTIFRYDFIDDTLELVASLDDYVLGRSPYGSLTKAADGNLYGMVSFGGTDDFGVMLRYKTDTKTLSSLFEFKDSLGTIPFGSLLAYDSFTLYGCTYQGGINDLGVLFSYDIKNDNYTVLHHFDGSSTGSYPQGRLVVHPSDSTLYGVTQSGGANFAGTLFSYKPSTATYTKLKDFGSGMGSNSSGNLMVSKDGLIIGTARDQGQDGKGLVFTYDPVNDSLFSLSYFNGINGEKPSGELIEYCKPSRVSLKRYSCYQMMSPSGKYVWSNSGTYIDTIASIYGCDSIMSIELTIADSSVSNVELATCDSFLAPDGQVLKSSGNYRLNITNYQGCDSIIYLNLDILNSSYDTMVNTCDSFVASDGSVFKSTGNYLVHLVNHNGCDSLIRLDLKVLRSEFDTVFRACRVFVAPDLKVYRNSGYFHSVLTNSKGCDSLIRFQLIIDTVNTNVIANDEVLQAELDGAAYRWLDCSDYSPMAGAQGRQFTATKNGNYAVEIKIDNCVDTSECVRVSNLSLELNELAGLNVYPNPSGGSFELVSSLGAEISEIELISTDGKILYSEKVEDKYIVPVEINGPAGVYFLKVKCGDDTFVIKVIKT